MAAFSATLGMGIISPFLPEFAKQHGANGFWVGMIFAGYGISRAIIVPIIGKVSDKFGRKIFVVSGLFLFTVISLLYPRANSIYLLTLIRMLHGLAAGMIIPVVMAYVGEYAEEGKTGLTTGTLNMMFYMGLAAGPFLGGYLGQEFGFDSVFYIMSILGGITCLIVVLLLPDLRLQKNASQKEHITFSSLIKYHFIKAVLISAAIMALMISVFLSFLPSLADSIRIDPDHIGIILSFGIFFAGIFQILFGRLADKLTTVGKLIQIGTGTTIGMLCLFIMPLCPNFHALLITGGILGLGASISAPALLSLSVGIGKRAGMGFWMAILSTAMSVGVVITPLLAGVIMDHYGIDAVFYSLGLVMLFCGSFAAHFIHLRMLGIKQ